MFESSTIDPTWPHIAWWEVLLAWCVRCQSSTTPLSCSWIPAHVLEHIPESLLDEDMARVHKTTVANIVHNRKADQAAKQAAMKAVPIYPEMYPPLCEAVLQRQEWLTSLSFLIGTSLPPFQEDSEAENDEDLVSAAVQYPRLPWDADRSHFTWQCHQLFPHSPVQNWKASQGDWGQLVHFLTSLVWKATPDAAISYAELAVLFHCRSYRYSVVHGDEHGTFRCSITWLKGAFRSCNRFLDFTAYPGAHDAHRNITWEKTMPAGAIVGALPFRSNSKLEFLVAVSRRLVKAGLQTWDFSCHDFPPL